MKKLITELRKRYHEWVEKRHFDSLVNRTISSMTRLYDGAISLANSDQTLEAYAYVGEAQHIRRDAIGELRVDGADPSFVSRINNHALHMRNQLFANCSLRRDLV